VNHSGPPSRFRPDVADAILSLAEKAGPVANDNVRVYWSDDGGWKVEPRRDALLRCIGNADFAMQIAIIRRGEPTPKQAKAVLEKVARSLEKARADLAVLFGDAALREYDSVKMALLDSADKIAERIGGFPHYPPREWPLPIENLAEPNQSTHWTDYQSSNFLHDLWSGISYAAKAATAAAQRYDDGGTASSHRSDLTREDSLAIALGQTNPANAALAMIHAAWAHVLERKPVVIVDRISGVSGGAYLEFIVGILNLVGFKGMGTDAARSRLRNMGLI